MIWLLSAVICLFIAKRRHVRNTALRASLVALFGPLAVPFVLLAKADAA
jgi:hypothetical protein